MQDDNVLPPGGESPASLARRLNLPFGDDLRLLTRALTHRSYVNENPNTPADNERLEFLGDAVLDFVVGAWAYQHYPEMPEGDLTKLRSALVRTEMLASFARKLNLGQAMRLGRGELQAGGGQRDALLCATFEAIVGALYQQCGLEIARQFVLPFIEPAADEVVSQFSTLDPKSRLQEWSQSRGLGVPRYKTVAIHGPDHAPQFEIEVFLLERSMGRGMGTSKQAASQAAAQAALEQISKTDFPEES